MWSLCTGSHLAAGAAVHEGQASLLPTPQRAAVWPRWLSVLPAFHQRIPPRSHQERVRAGGELIPTPSLFPGRLSLAVQVISVVVQAGERGREPAIPSPLMYTWHGKHYLGAAHGLAGIATLLLQVSALCYQVRLCGNTEHWTRL